MYQVIMPRDRLLPILLTALTSLLFAGSFIAGKYTTVELRPILTTLLRYLIALVFLFSLLIHRKQSSLLVQKKDVFLLALLGLFGVVGYPIISSSSFSACDIRRSPTLPSSTPSILSSRASRRRC
ncbi:EamA family transporter [Thermoleptolyngbya sp. C42_A2020_037]|uniref:EamA family transporter n=1 Tax=Thermoleptolyngbya sp. C42_A2020_037 TaxID=2747799 RepID=UPI0025FE6C4C|nr:EamA family transporter [Thermoleptolyngbya sp. C42_A2020_037]